jgi:hypothetical protein
MNKISSVDGLSILVKWKDERAILLFGYTDSGTGEYRSWWVLVNKVISGGSPAILLTQLADPFPFSSLKLKGAAFEYGDSRELRDSARLGVFIDRPWICFLAVRVPSGNVVLFAELSREAPRAFNL